MVALLYFKVQAIISFTFRFTVFSVLRLGTEEHNINPSGSDPASISSSICLQQWP